MYLSPGVPCCCYRLVREVFGRYENVNDVMPSPAKIVALLWIYRTDEDVVQYFCQLVEKVRNANYKIA